MPAPTQIKTFRAGGAIAERTLVKFGANDDEVVQAAAATDLIIGVCVQPGGAASGARCDVVIDGIAEVLCGGAITRGAAVTSDAAGKAVAAAPGAGTNNRIVGFALRTYANNDVGDVLVSQGVMQG
jgi:hypothetical protein